MRYFTNRAGVERRTRTTRPLTEEDPWWWCQGCAEQDHDRHVGAYLDPFGVDAACACPTCGG